VVQVKLFGRLQTYGQSRNAEVGGFNGRPHRSRNGNARTYIFAVIDAAQAVPHMKVDIEKLGCDFFAFSGHKMLGPTGIGVLWARKSVLETMSPFHGGGDMIREVHKYETTWNDLPYKFEAGTPNIADVIGFGAAIDYLSNIGMDKIRQHEIEITQYALEKLSKVNSLKIYGTNDISKRGGVISFNFADVHPHDVAQIIDEEGIAVRSGHHCAQVLMEKLDVAATSRASFYIYNNKADVGHCKNQKGKYYASFYRIIKNTSPSEAPPANHFSFG